MTETTLRPQKLRRNFYLMFWTNAFLNVKLIAMIATVFYLHRGLTNTEIFYTSIVWAIVMIILEMPSSYLADKWGRKKLIITGCLLNICTLLVYLFSWGFWLNALAVAFLAASFAAFSGTDEALIYDTGKELGQGKESFKNLGKFYAGNRVFKIFTPIIATFIAQDLSADQFNLLIYLDIATVLIALFMAIKLTEPNHFMDVEKMEKGVFKDAAHLLDMHPEMKKAMLSRTLIFISGFIVWRIQQDYFLDLGLSLLIVGIFWGLTQLIVYLVTSGLHKLEKSNTVTRLINLFNLLYLFLLGLFVFFGFNWVYPLLLLALNCLFQAVEAIRWPIYSYYFNEKSASYNRATTLSLTSLLKSLLDIPLLFLAALLVSYDTRYVFVLALVLAIIVYFSTLLKPLPK
ncbi:MFS transporter [Candidatus Peregrinibacteria bacterium]|nr:MFS transporter [Candidatus Peregrinibacteria bacterium]